MPWSKRDFQDHWLASGATEGFSWSVITLSLGDHKLWHSSCNCLFNRKHSAFVQKSWSALWLFKSTCWRMGECCSVRIVLAWPELVNYLSGWFFKKNILIKVLSSNQVQNLKCARKMPNSGVPARVPTPSLLCHLHFSGPISPWSFI